MLQGANIRHDRHQRNIHKQLFLSEQQPNRIKKIKEKQKRKQFSDDMKIQSDKFHLNINYDLPLKELQYTQTRKYKQNLNPIFQLLATNNHRYTNERKNYSHYDYNEPLTSSHKYRYLDDHQAPQKSKKYEHLFEKRSKLEQQPKITNEESIKVTSLNVKSELLNVKKDLNRNKKYLDFYINDIVPSSTYQNRNYRQKQKPIKINDTTHQNIPLKKDLIKDESQNTYSHQLALQYLRQAQIKNNHLLKQIQEGHQKITILNQTVKMLKQKNILKEQQILFHLQQKLRQQKKQKKLQKQLKAKKQKYANYESQHHQIFNLLKQNKKQLKKQQEWLQQENSAIKSIKKQLQNLMSKIKKIQDDHQKRQNLILEIQQQQQINNELKTQLQQGNVQLQGLKQQIMVVEDETQTLQLHEKQLYNLQLKFKAQTQKIKEQLQHLTSKLNFKTSQISQQNQIDSMIKDLELQVGQMHQQKIILQEHLQQTYHQISIKNNNIKHIKNLQYKKSFQPSYHKKQIKYDPVLSLQTKAINPNHQQKIQNNDISTKQKPLSTIRQQSKNTSLYQTPKNQQVFITQQNQQSYHPFSEKSLDIQSQVPSKTQIFQPNQISNNKKQSKKYFIIESEEDASSNSKSFYALRKTEDFLFNKNKEFSSIQQKIEQQKYLNVQNKKLRKSFLNSQDLDLISNKNEYKEKSKQRLKKNKSLEQKQRGSEQRSIENQSEEAFQNLIQRFQQIKSNSYFD